MNEWGFQLQELAAALGRISLQALPLALIAVALSWSRCWTPGWRLTLLALALVRLALPVVPENPWHPGNWSTVSPPLEGPAIIGSSATISLNDVALPIPAVPQDRTPFWGWVWLGGAGAVLTFYFALHLRLHRRLRTARTVQEPRLNQGLQDAARDLELRVLPRLVTVPGWNLLALTGVFRPRLIVPPDLADRFDPEALRSMFRHELAHLKRRDLVWQKLFLLVCAVHWFNPLAWLLLRRWRVEVELRCDAIALAQCPPEGRARYGHALVSLVESVSLPAPVGTAALSQRHLNLRQRMQLIVSPKSIPFAGRAAAILLTTTLAWTQFSVAPVLQADEPRPIRREGEGVPRVGPRDGEGPVRRGPRDGEGPVRRGPRDGESRPAGPREGDRPRMSPEREGAPRRSMEREGRVSPEREMGPRRSPERPGQISPEGEAGPRRSMERPGEGAAERGNRSATQTVGAVTIQVNAAGQVLGANGRALSTEQLRTALQQVALLSPGRTLVIRANQAVPIAQLQTLMQECQRAGFENLRLATGGF